METLEHHLQEAQAQVQRKITELQEVRLECDELEEVVAGAEQELSEREDQLSNIRQELGRRFIL